MKNTISVAEFQEIVEWEQYNSYRYSTENQPWDDGGVGVLCRQHLAFQSVHISPMMPGHPAVTFTGADGSMTLLNVCEVERDKNMFTLYCNPWEKGIERIGYTIAAEKN